MNAQPHENPVSEEEFWALVETSSEKLEWYNGRVVPLHREPEAIAGSGYVHARLIMRLSKVLESSLEGKRCTATGSELHVQAGALRTIPDNAVHCEDGRFSGKSRNVLLNPVALFEVLSPGTQNYDRNEKFEHYQQIPSLQDYVLISQDRVRVEHFSRVENGWFLRIFHSRTDIVVLASIEVELPLSQLYLGIDVPEQLTLWSGDSQL